MAIIVYGENASRTHENLMLQAFLHHLEDRWADSTDWIYVIANALWNGAEIDLVCILPSAILVADFKDHGGELSGTENGPWQADGVLVRGGRKANPYQQLRDNKFSLLNWLEAKGLLPGRNLGHIAAAALFSKRVENRLDLPERVRSWFHVTDLDRCTALLSALASPQLNIHRDEAERIIQSLGVQQIAWASARPQVRDLAQGVPTKASRPPLTAHQQDALAALRCFLENDDIATFSVLGMTSTGKSRLLAEVAEEAQRIGKPVVVLQPNRRLADGADVHANSIYSHLYSGGVEEEGEDDARGREVALKVIPLRQCEDSADCVYLIDNAHLLGNARFSTPDGKQYGSGQLLTDFFAFAEVDRTQRKAVFFGDPYQIQRGGAEESALSGVFQTARGLSHQSMELTQLIDTTRGSAKLVNAERIVSAIRSKRFAALELDTDDEFTTRSQEDAKTTANEILEAFRADPQATWCLVETNEKAKVLTQWLRQRLHNKQLPSSVEPGDLLEIYVAPDARDPFGSRIRMRSGGRVSVSCVGDRTEYSQGLNWVANGPVRFHSIRSGIDALAGTELDVFEEFLVAEKPELSKEVAVAENVWRSRLKRARARAMDQSQGRLAGVEPQDVPPPAPEFTYARYGYAATVHHAQGMTQPVCYINCDHSAGRHSEGFFRWLYSALTIAERQLILLNHSPIHPFDQAVWNAAAVNVVRDIPVGAGWSFDPEAEISEQDARRDVPQGLNESRQLRKSVAIWLRIAKAAESLGWRVARVACHPYQERYELVGPNGENDTLRVAYNARHVVTGLHGSDTTDWKFLASLASACLMVCEYSAEADALLQTIRARLETAGWSLVSATETAYRLTITIAREVTERITIEINFNGQGLVTSIRPIQTTGPGLLDVVRETLL